MTNSHQQRLPSGWRVVLENESGESQVFPVIRDEFLIGRALTTDLPLDDARISRHHARLTRQGAYLLVEDLNSFNGTLVNGNPITGQHLLNPQDVIEIGPFRVHVEKATDYPPPDQATAAYRVAEARLPRAPALLLLGLAVILVLVALLGIIAGAAWLFTRSRPEQASEIATTAAARSGPTIMINQGPADNSELSINEPVRVEATAADSEGVKRLELWVNGRKIDEKASQTAQLPSSLTASWRWTPLAPGSYNLEVRAYGQSDTINLLPIASLTVEAPPTPTLPPTSTSSPTATTQPTATLEPTAALSGPMVTSAPTPTITPTQAPVTATPAPPTLGVTVSGLNVRAGPGPDYEAIGVLQQGERAEIMGQADTDQGLWWQIRYNAAPQNRGWVSASAAFGTATNVARVPQVTPPPLPRSATPTAPLPTATAAATATPEDIYIRAPAGKALLILSNRSHSNQPARLTLSGGESAAGGLEIDVQPGQDVEMTLNPDFYQAMWSSTARGGFSRSADFTASEGEVLVVWIRPEDGLTETESYYQLPRSDKVTPPPPTATPEPFITGYTAPPGKAVLVVANLSTENDYGQVTVSGGSFGGGREIKLDPNSEIALELEPANNYRVVWTSPAYGGVTGGLEFKASAGEVILGWIIPEDQVIFMQFPGQSPKRINQ